MMKWLGSQSIVRVEIVLLAWLFVGGVAWADTLDLSDDISSPLAGIQQAIEPDDPADLKAVPLSVVDHAVVEGTLLPEDTPCLASTSTFQLPQSSSHVPLYQILCVYRISDSLS